MFLRWLTGILILGFCSVMTVLLVRMAYFPEESRLAKEDPELVMERFLSRVGTESSLDIWKGNEPPVGYLRVEPHVMSPSEQERTGAVATLWVDGMVRLPLGLQGSDKINLSAKLAMDLKASVKESEMKLSMLDLGLILTITQKAKQTEPTLILSQGGFPILDSSTMTSADGSSKSLLAMLLSAIGQDPSRYEKQEKEMKAVADQSVTEARRGGFEVQGEQFNGYVLTTTLGGDRKITLYISESGELIQLKTFLDYRFISDGLRPEGVNGVEPPKMKRGRLPGPPTIKLPK